MQDHAREAVGQPADRSKAALSGSRVLELSPVIPPFPKKRSSAPGNHLRERHKIMAVPSIHIKTAFRIECEKLRGVPMARQPENPRMSIFPQYFKERKERPATPAIKAAELFF
jgi:hypothetical protein